VSRDISGDTPSSRTGLGFTCVYGLLGVVNHVRVRFTRVVNLTRTQARAESKLSSTHIQRCARAGVCTNRSFLVSKARRNELSSRLVYAAPTHALLERVYATIYYN
jgi:hypothetical protein